MAGPNQAAEVIRRLYQDQLQPELFEPGMLARVPLEAISGVLARHQAELGALQIVEPITDGRWRAQFVRGEVEIRLTLSTTGQIAGLFFGPTVPASADPRAVIERLAALPGLTHGLIRRGEHVLAAHAADRRLEIASVFKLAVAAALSEALTTGREHADRVVTLAARHRSLPSGILQDWPEATPLTVATLAGLMLTLSDNTAADLLIEVLGPNAVEAEAPDLAPLLTTREYFILHARDRAAEAATFAAAAPAERRRLRDALRDAPLPRPSELDVKGSHGVGWQLDAHSIVRLLERAASLPQARIQRGPFAGGPWRTVVYKGGESVRVASLAAWLQPVDGAPITLAMTWNDSQAEPGRLAGLALAAARAATA